MPHLKVQTATGNVLFNYVISTPDSENAQNIDPSLPTILFLHPVYVSAVMFHNQFASPRLRRFNLVGVDARCHGNTVGPVPPTARRAEVAEDVSKFIEALKLPRCHIVGVSMGACVALQMAVAHPEQVLSTFMISPLPLVEPDDVASGRQEIYDCWVAGRKNDNPDEDAMLDAVLGAVQLGFNQSNESIVSALVQYTLPQAIKNWSPENFGAFHTVSVDFFVDRKPHDLAQLRQIECPVHLVHCGGDVAYPLHYVEELRSRLASAGLQPRLSQVKDAPHFGNVTHSEEINDLLHDWVMEHSDGPIPRAKSFVKSPFADELAKCGLRQNGESDSEDDLVPL
ncbi:Protein ABHD11 [Psilocybe cubensis]|uniref:Protein ABHD11 n=2 Tax=Psilocybe cubensis TaxID=181762 RepID=A0ACB8GT11_PSICU|nr:Protein ABHD11 [Psilocybe cubensis]KAH9478562.1 Protein ABHD11 [Psilocybe cubensis]